MTRPVEACVVFVEVRPKYIIIHPYIYIYIYRYTYQKELTHTHITQHV